MSLKVDGAPDGIAFSMAFPIETAAEVWAVSGPNSTELVAVTETYDEEA